MKSVIYIYIFTDGSIQTSAHRHPLTDEGKPRLAPMHGAQRVLAVRSADGRVVVLKDKLGMYSAGQTLDEIPGIVLPENA